MNQVENVKWMQWLNSLIHEDDSSGSINYFCISNYICPILEHDERKYSEFVHAVNLFREHQSAEKFVDRQISCH